MNLFERLSLTGILLIINIELFSENHLIFVILFALIFIMNMSFVFTKQKEDKPEAKEYLESIVGVDTIENEDISVMIDNKKYSAVLMSNKEIKVLNITSNINFFKDWFNKAFKNDVELYNSKDYKQDIHFKSEKMDGVFKGVFCTQVNWGENGYVILAYDIKSFVK